MLNWIVDDRFSVQLGSLTKELVQDLFFREEFYGLHRSTFSHLMAFQLVDVHRKESYGAAHFVEVEPGFFRSPGRGSYGGAQFHKSIPFQIRQKFIKTIHDHLLGIEAKKIQFVLPPEIYDLEDHSYQVNMLHQLGYKIKNVELNYSFDLKAENFENLLDHGNRKRLKKAERENLVFSEIPNDKLDLAYAVIKENREKKGYPLTMTLQALQEMASQTSDRLHCYGVYHNEVCIAASICIRINEKINYVFYWGEVVGSEALSPITFLAQNLFLESQKKGFVILDLGISTLNSEPNLGLMKYKSNLGCQSTLKMTFDWSK